MFADKRMETTTTIGTGSYTLAGAPVGSAFQTIRSGLANGGTGFFFVQSADGTKWEAITGTITYGPPDTLTRTLLNSPTGIALSSTGALISWVAGDNPVIFSYPSGVALAHLITGGLNTTRPAWAQAGLGWLDDTLGLATTWVKKRFLGSNVDAEEGRFYITPGIFVANPAKFWVDKGTVPYTVTTDDPGKVILQDVTAASRAVTLPQGSTVKHGFAVHALGYGSSANSIVLTPNAADKIDQGATGATLSVPGLFRVTVEWDGAKGQWRTNYAPGATVNYALGSGFMNRLRNGSFLSWPQGTSGSVLTAPTGSQYITANGWAAFSTGANAAWSQVTTGANGAAQSLKLTGATGVTDIKLAQRIESLDGAAMAGLQVTFQAEITNNTGAAIVPTLQARYPAASADTWTGTPVVDLASPNLQSCASGATTLVAYSWLVNANAVLGYELQIDFGNNFSTSGKNVVITAAELRVTPGVSTGLVSSPALPEIRDVAAELLRNARYLQASYDNGVAPGTATRAGLQNIGNNGTGSTNGVGFTFPNRMRAAPTMSFWDGAGGSGKSSKYQSGSWSDAIGTLSNIQISQGGWIGLTTDGAGIINWTHYLAYADLW